MSNFYKTSFEGLRLDAGFTEALSALERGFERFGIDYYLVGAVSRNAWLSGIHHVTPSRTTGDVDFAVLINNTGVYEELKQYLIETEGFQPFHQNAFVLIWKDGTEIDLLPFGAIEDEYRKVTIHGTGYTSVHVDGFNEVYQQGLPEMELDEGHRFKFASLAGIVLLKLIAWDDRPEVRADDISDISEILDHFFEINKEQIWEEHADLFMVEPVTDDGRDGLLLIAAKVLGKELKEIASQTPALFERLTGIISGNTINAASSAMGKIMAQYFDVTVEQARLIIKEIEIGLVENGTNNTS
jgi:predicted nucleotidyltransferase